MDRQTKIFALALGIFIVAITVSLFLFASKKNNTESRLASQEKIANGTKNEESIYDSVKVRNLEEKTLDKEVIGSISVSGNKKTETDPDLVKSVSIIE